MNIITRNLAGLRRALLGAVAASVAAGLAFIAPDAHAQSGGIAITGAAGAATTCTAFNGFTWNGTTLSINCTATTAAGGSTGGTTPGCDTTQSGAFSWVATTATVQAGSNTTVQVQRTGGCQGAYSITYDVYGAGLSGYAPNGPGSVSFGDGDAAPKSINVTAGNVAGTLYIWLNGYTSTSSVRPPISGTVTITITPVAAKDWHTDAATPQVAGCATSGTYYNWFTYQNQQIEYGISTNNNPGLKPGESLALPFIYGNQGQLWQGYFQTTEVINVASGVSSNGNIDHEVAISQCPGDFSPPTGCDVHGPANGTSASFFTGTTPNGYQCPLTIGNKYYVNVRQVTRTSPYSPTCTNSTGGCAIRVQGTTF